MKNRLLKLYIAVVSIAAFAAFFSGCKKTVNEGTPTPEPVPTATAEVFEFDLATPSPSPTPVPTPTPTPRVASEYTIAWMSDPQYYSRKNNGVFEIMTRYLKENREKLNLQYIVFTGDFVHEHENEEQWIIADRAMKTIDDIPNGVLAGNHDVGSDPEMYSYDSFCKYFGENRYASKPWYGESYKNNRGHYDLISIGKSDYIFVYLGFQIDDGGVAFAKSAFDRYPDRVGVLCVHGYFDTDLTLLEDGVRLRDEVVQPCSNVYMVMCGHRYNSACIPMELDDNSDGKSDRTVIQMIANYQAIGDKKAGELTGGDGYMRFLDINESENVVNYYSYSPYLDDYTYFDDPKHQKEKYAFTPESEQGSFPIPWVSKYKD